MALSKRTVNKHNIRRAEVFKENGLNNMDVQYAHPNFIGYGNGECTLCGQKNLKWLFSIRFEAPGGMVALAKVMTDIIRDSEVTLHPIGSKCITDWLDAVPETAEKLEALKRWDREMVRCREAMKAKVVEDLCEDAGFETPEDAYTAWHDLQQSYAGRITTYRTLGRYDAKRLSRNAKKIRYKTGARKTVQEWLKDLLKVLAAPLADVTEPTPRVSPVRRGLTYPKPAPVVHVLSKDHAALLARGKASMSVLHTLPSYQQNAFTDITRKVESQGKFVSERQLSYYADMIKKLEKASSPPQGEGA